MLANVVLLHPPTRIRRTMVLDDRTGMPLTVGARYLIDGETYEIIHIITKETHDGRS